VDMVDFQACCPVILEHALLSVKPSEEAAFESAFAEAKAIIAAMPGFLRRTLSRCLEHPSTYLLLVEWDRLVGPYGGLPRLAPVSRVAPAVALLLRALSGSGALRTSPQRLIGQQQPAPNSRRKAKG
jgi:hypothetical protein